MRGEFLDGNKLVVLEVRGPEPPRYVVTAARRCPKSPTKVYHLELERIDERGVAVYRVTEAEPR